MKGWRCVSGSRTTAETTHINLDDHFSRLCLKMVKCLLDIIYRSKGNAAEPVSVDVTAISLCDGAPTQGP